MQALLVNVSNPQSGVLVTQNISAGDFQPAANGNVTWTNSTADLGVPGYVFVNATFFDSNGRTVATTQQNDVQRCIRQVGVSNRTTMPQTTVSGPTATAAPTTVATTAGPRTTPTTIGPRTTTTNST